MAAGVASAAPGAAVPLAPANAAAIAAAMADAERVAAAAAAGTPEAAARSKVVLSWVGRPMRVALTDGRVIGGTLLCIDSTGTVVLRHAYVVSEIKIHNTTSCVKAAAPVPAPAYVPIYLNTVLLGARHIVRIELLAEPLPEPGLPYVWKPLPAAPAPAAAAAAPAIGAAANAAAAAAGSTAAAAGTSAAASL